MCRSQPARTLRRQRLGADATKGGPVRMHPSIADYLSTVEQAIRRIDPREVERVVDVLFDACVSGRRVYAFGNGASAALAAHMACDYGKGSAPDLGEGLHDSCASRLRIIALTDNAALLTAYGNDIRYEDVFLEQLKNHLEPGDVVLGVSGSGGSPNVLRALEFARKRGAVTVGFTGQQPPAVRMAGLCDVCLRVPLALMEQIEDLHVVAHHAIACSLRARVAAWHQAMTPSLVAAD